MGSTLRAEGQAGTRLFSRGAVVSSCAGFVLIGALQALYGPAISAFRGNFGLSPSGAGLALSAHFVGGVLGVLLFQRIHRTIGNRRMIGASYLLMAVGAAGFALAPWWSVALPAALVTGLGFGGIDYGLNQLFSIGFGARSTAMLNVLNAQFGVGAILGPALVGLLGPERYGLIFGGFAVLSAALLLTLRGVGEGQEDLARAGSGDGSGTGIRRAWGLLAAFLVLYVLHVGVESGVGGWEPTHLETAGYSARAAASATAVYWLMMTVGRLVAAPLSLRWSAPAIVIGGLAGMLACLLLALVPALAPYAYAGVGLFIAPIFPTGLPWLTRLLPGTSGYIVAASMIGGVAVPPVTGKAIEWYGVGAVPVVLAVLTAACLAAAVWIRLARR
ncbi:MFS transporter [Sphaerisporangium fuscum]|uniref:MFS transporter n=1 Tax=Sphaerisporangium fuscum TaxID=2835868 RepID=UPI001BDD9F7C|nr:MFS transporter [Sphaerisporangium fuscum]